MKKYYYKGKKMKSKVIAFGGCAAGIGLILSGLSMKAKQKSLPSTKKRHIPDYIKPLIAIGGEETIQIIAMDPQWAELCERASEFYVLAKEEYAEVLLSVSEVVKFQMELQMQGKKPSFGTPRIFRKHLHAVVEAVRMMRAVIEEKSPSSLDDFDEIASDIQKAHDDAAYNMQLDALS